MRYTDSELAMVKGMPKSVAEGFLKAHRAATDWGDVRAYLDEVGMDAVKHAAEKGVPSDVAGERVADFNDMVIDGLKRQSQ